MILPRLSARPVCLVDGALLAQAQAIVVFTAFTQEQSRSDGENKQHGASLSAITLVCAAYYPIRVWGVNSCPPHLERVYIHILFSPACQLLFPVAGCEARLWKEPSRRLPGPSASLLTSPQIEPHVQVSSEEYGA